MLPVTVDAENGKVLLEVRALDTDLIHTSTLVTGLGAPSPLLDRGQMGEVSLVRFERHGPRVLLVRVNDSHRVLDGNTALAQSVAESFPRSILAAFEIVDERDDALVVDATAFMLEDTYGIAQGLQNADRGRASLDRARSYVDARNTAAFPRNTEIRAVLTFKVEEPDAVLRRHAPDARSVTFEHQHSFLALPDDGYTPRVFHPRAGSFPHVFFDFAQGLDTDYRRRWIWRWRLVPSDPEAYLRGELTPPVTPIVYHLDPAIPEPYRSAFIEGGMWWNRVFEEAGFRDAFRIEPLPEGADPMDARYNVLHWVHRSERGPSVGPSYRDPRTGEIIRALVRMDSYRSLVNHDIWMGFRPAAGPNGPALDSEAMAMARRRQHTAHEIGHTLGLAHNFIAATQGRASVMDYPVPLVTLDDDGNIDLSDAYAPGPGAFDRFAIRYAYTWFPDAASERAGLAAIVREADAAGLRFITGGDASPAGSIPAATTWVEGDDMRAALQRTLAVRARLIEAFDERALDPGEPYWFLNKRFAHVYLHHRTALQGATKYLGGVEYSYALMGEGLVPTRRIPADEQRAALELLLSALDPQQLQVPDRVVDLMAPQPFGWSSGWMWSGETAPMNSDSGAVFNPLYIARSLAQEIVDGVLHPERMHRLQAAHASDPAYPSPDEVLGTLVDRTWGSSEGPHAALSRAVQRAVLDGLLDLAGDERTGAMVRAVAERRLIVLQDALERQRRGEPEDRAHREAAHRDIARYLAGDDDPARRPRPAPIPLPWP
jgi:hypothetical protein